MKTIGNIIAVLICIAIGIPLLIIFMLFYTPYSYVRNYEYRRKRKKELEEALIQNNGKIIFLYGEYHTFNFLKYFKDHYPEIQCLQVYNGYNTSGVFVDHLTKNRKAKSLPQLVKIDGKNILKKEHYNSFKHYIRRNNDADSFFKLIESSIKNLESLPSKQL
ncbi:hypothetical protein [uncultured Kordia sp.]|uniref:hypothetical protein n=1 Tax=uncultured Kordia sp. TaxID=507699 RepID=UPI00263892C2|nr:hypothetical protein [uncultured Kordia sp.]